jgi:M3 family oligoendopeptidase
MKFKDMPYERIQVETIQSQLDEKLARITSASSAKEVLAVLRETDALNRHLTTVVSLAQIRNTLDTRDAFYEGEKEYWDAQLPVLEETIQKLSLALLQSKFRKELETEIAPVYFQNIELKLKAFRADIIPDLQADNVLTTEYQKLLASAQIPFDGKVLTLPQLQPYHESEDRLIRKSSMEARANWFLGNGERLNSLYDELVVIRNRRALTLGYPSYVELGYYEMTRNCYDAKMVSAFRDEVVKYVVPLALRVKQQQAKRIGLGNSKLPLYDDPFNFPDGNAKPIGSPEEIFAHGKKMYHELSPQTGEFIDFMLEHDLFDVLTRPGKAGGGYCTALPDYKAPFIFANFNGTSGDIDVLTHEAGHAFAGYLSQDVFPMDLAWPTYEAAEVHSMSMEFLTWPWMEGFFGDKADKYRYSHLAGALTFIPYGTMVDHFQHIVYENPSLTPAQRNEKWKELEGIYRPWLDLDLPFYNEGRRWQAQSHIYERPFYYIDYCLAQTVSLQFWAMAQKDRTKAWDHYMRYTQKGGTLTFTELLTQAGMTLPFEKDALKDVATEASAWLDRHSI